MSNQVEDSPLEVGGGKRILFIDRDGVILQEPPVDFQVDSTEKTSFIKVTEIRWTNLFFILPEYSYKSVWTYIKISKGLSGNQFMYLLKYSINKPDY